ncbi:hypothetical protein P280DRAFT_548868 [Massarina eburnea CBS 473.64]|uniref:Uncharacterized protein n=1 Tax=Massarina eburnea CBS 473.64 TaxID=1395130 RepID=A0A6A6RZV5_9PLEO|nr:hypothetical protein P280DRAFT_548868 [Massarina eburnea CBS 473.64]
MSETLTSLSLTRAWPVHNMTSPHHYPHSENCAYRLQPNLPLQISKSQTTLEAIDWFKTKPFRNFTTPNNCIPHAESMPAIAYENILANSDMTTENASTQAAQMPGMNDLTPGWAYFLSAVILLLFWFLAIKRIFSPRPYLTIDYYLPRSLFTFWAPGRKRIELEEEIQVAIKREEERQLREHGWNLEERRPRVWGTVDRNMMAHKNGARRKQVPEEIELDILSPRDRGDAGDLGLQKVRY